MGAYAAWASQISELHKVTTSPAHRVIVRVAVGAMNGDLVAESRRVRQAIDSRTVLSGNARSGPQNQTARGARCHTTGFAAGALPDHRRCPLLHLCDPYAVLRRGVHGCL